MATRRIGFAAAAFLLGWASGAFGHSPDAEVIAFHTAALQETPEDMGHLLGRADLYLRAGRFEESKRDLQRALALDPTGPEVNLGWAEWELLAGHPDAAEPILAKILNEHPEIIGGWRLRARVRRAAGDALGEANALDQVLALDPSPADYLARAKLAASLAGPHAEIDVLEHGIVELGAPTLRWRLIEIAGGADLERALRHLAALELQMDCPEIAVAKRGDVLAASGRNMEALAEWTRALGALESESARRRTPAREALARELRALLSEGANP